jgi:hypothetical protein
MFDQMLDFRTATRRHEGHNQPSATGVLSLRVGAAAAAYAIRLAKRKSSGCMLQYSDVMIDIFHDM